MAWSAFPCGDDGFEWLAIDRVKKVALFDEGALLEIHRLEKPLDARADVHILEALSLSDQLEVHRHVLLHRRRVT